MAEDDKHIDLCLLQERCRKDPLSYRQEYEWQERHFQALLASAKMQPSEPSPRLAEVAGFMGAVSHLYDKDSKSFISDVTSFLSDSGTVMNPELRRALVRLLGLLRARNSADPTVIIPLFMRLMQCNDKQLRHMLHGHIISDLKKVQLSGHSSRRALQSFLFSTVEDPSAVLVKRSLHVFVDLFRKKVWNDAKCANLIAQACFHPDTSVAVIATKFLLNSNSTDNDPEFDEDEDDDDEEEVALPSKKGGKSRDGQKAADMWKAYNMTGKKTSKKRKRMERVIKRATRVKSSTSTAPLSHENPGPPSFEAMMLLNDPQDFAERMFSDLQTRRRKESYETRLLFINLITRLVGTHGLILLNLYPFLQRYLQPSQPEVTRVLAYLTQGCHDLVPPDVLHPILRGLADTFVSDRSSPPSMAAGINAIRAICSRVPLAILDSENDSLPAEEQEAPLLLDLVQYKSSKDKGIVMAARSLIMLYRDVNPGLLQKKDRGKTGTVAVQKGDARGPIYGEHLYATGVEGLEFLQGKENSDSDEEVGESEESSEEQAVKESNQDGADKHGKDKVILPETPIGKTDNNEMNRSTSDRSSDSEHCNEEHDDTIKRNESVLKPNSTHSKLGDVDAESDDAEIESDSDAESFEGGLGELDETGDEISGEEDCGTNEDGVEIHENSAESRKLDEIKILTNEDYAKIRARRAALAVGECLLTKDPGKAVNPEDIQGPLRRGRRTLAERLESVLEGRKDRVFGSRKGLNKGGGSTNKKKLKTKANSMVIHKRRKRGAMSRREKQISKRRKRDYR